VSKAFTDEEAAETPPIVRPRPPLPPGVPNYVTPRGLARLREELEALGRAREGSIRELSAAERSALAQRRSELESRISSAELVALPADAQGTIRFGAIVTLAGVAGVRRYRIVGVDEADAAAGRIAFVAPLARALMGREAGDVVRVRTPAGDERLEIVAVEYRDEDERD
jgi:transcription elongation factor GreB